MSAPRWFWATLALCAVALTSVLTFRLLHNDKAQATAFAPAAHASGFIAPGDAKDHVGERVTIVGVVADVTTMRDQMAFLNFGARYPNHVFSAVIPQSAAPDFPDPQKWYGQRVAVLGEIQLYQGKPQIVLTDALQLRPAR